LFNTVGLQCTKVINIITEYLILQAIAYGIVFFQPWL